MARIDNTAEYGTSGLDEGQAMSLLSAVSGSGLSLVEPGPIPDPVAAGLKAAIRRCRAAWEATQPQLTISGWAAMFDELDEARLPAGLVQLVGLTTGAEPRRAPSDNSTAPSATPNADGSAPFTCEGDGANHMRGARRPQKGA